MRIALDASYSVDPQPSGIGVYSSEILNGLASTYPRDEFLRCYRPRKYWNAPPIGRKRLLLSSFPTFRADLFHALNQRLDRRPANRVVCTFHDLFVLTAEYSSAEFRARFAAQARNAARRADLIIAVSHFTARQVSDLLDVEPSRIRVVPHGVHMAPHGVHPVPQSETPREKIVLFVGALQTRKNLVRLIEAFEAMPPDWRLVLAGAPSGFGAAAILERVHARVEVTGYLPAQQLEQLYARASIFAFPSLDEGFGIPVLEAMAHGLPVITSNCSALPEVAGDAALLVDPRSSAEIAAALTRLAADTGLRQQLTSRGFERAKTFSWEQAVAATYSVYRELLPSSGY